MAAETTEFNLVLYPGDCLQETVSPDGTLGPIDYLIGSGLRPLEPTWTSSVELYTCPAKFAIYFDEMGSWVSLPPTIDGVVTADVLTFKPLNGFLDLDTADLSLD